MVPLSTEVKNPPGGGVLSLQCLTVVTKNL
jgi:hypothetical protein